MSIFFVKFLTAPMPNPTGIQMDKAIIDTNTAHIVVFSHLLKLANAYPPHSKVNCFTAHMK